MLKDDRVTPKKEKMESHDSTNGLHGGAGGGSSRDLHQQHSVLLPAAPKVIKGMAGYGAL